MKCVVTGGCGFIRSHLVGRLVHLGHEVVVADDLSTGDYAVLNPEVSLLEGSVTDLEMLVSATHGAAGSGCVQASVSTSNKLIARPASQ